MTALLTHLAIVAKLCASVVASGCDAPSAQPTKAASASGETQKPGNSSSSSSSSSSSDDAELGSWRSVHRVDETRFDALIVEAAAYYSLPAALVKAVVAVESSFDPAAVSVAGAQGLMQLMPATAVRMSVRDSLEPRDNVYGGCRYLRILANRFDGDLRLTLAAYNAGPEAVSAASGVPNIPETQRYVRRVLALYRHYLSKWRVDSP